jgi:hypothetical protein
VSSTGAVRTIAPAMFPTLDFVMAIGMHGAHAAGFVPAPAPPDIMCGGERTSVWNGSKLGSDREVRFGRVATMVRRRFPRPATDQPRQEVHAVLYTIAVVLLILWLLGLVTSYTLGGFLHILLVVAIVMVVLNLVSGRRSA